MADVGEFVATLKIVLEGNGLKEASAQMEHTQGKAGALDAIMGRFVITLGDVMNVGSKLAKGLWSVAQAAGDSELQTKRLADAMKAQGIYTDAAMEANLAYATSLQKITKYDDEAIVATMQLLTTFGLHDEQLRTTTALTANLASGLGIDLRTAAMLLGKAFAGETSTLSRYGIIIDESIPKSQRFAAAVAQIQQKFGDAASGEAQTFLGKVEQLKNSFDDLKEKIGVHVIPVFEYWMKKISGVITLLDKLAGVEKEVNTGKTWKDKVALLEQERARVEQNISVYAKYENQLKGVQKRNQDALHDRLRAIDSAIAGARKQAAEEERIAKKLAADISRISAGESQKDAAMRAAELEAERKLAADSLKIRMDMDSKIRAWNIQTQQETYLETAIIQANLVNMIAENYRSMADIMSAFKNYVVEYIVREIANQLLYAIGVAKALKAIIGSMTGGGILGGIGKIFGFAEGTDNAPGGMALVGEEGPEIVNLPRGSQVYTNRESAAMLAGAGGDAFVFNITMHGSSRKYADEVADRIVRKVNQNRKW